MAPDDGWTSPSDLADYAYCPRSHWYRHHPPAEGPSASSERRSRAGVRFHRHALRAEERRARHGAAYWFVLLVGLALVLTGFAWVLHP